MVLYDLECPNCGPMTDFAPAGGPYPVCPVCGMTRTKIFSTPAVWVAPWLRDENRKGVLKHREWLASDEAKKMDLQPARHSE